MRIFLVSGFLVELIQRIQSQRAVGVMSNQISLALVSVFKASCRSSGMFGSDHFLVASISKIVDLSVLMALLIVLSILNQ